MTSVAADRLLIAAGSIGMVLGRAGRGVFEPAGWCWITVRPELAWGNAGVHVMFPELADRPMTNSTPAIRPETLRDQLDLDIRTSFSSSTYFVARKKVWSVVTLCFPPALPISPRYVTLRQPPQRCVEM